MAILFLDEILDELKSEMDAAIDGTGIYETTPTIRRKMHSWEDTKGNRPFIWFTSTDVVVEKKLGDRAHITIEVGMECYAKSSGAKKSNSERMFKLYRDVLRFFYNDYSREFDIIKAPVVEGGLFEEVGRTQFGVVLHIYIAVNTITMSLET